MIRTNVFRNGNEVLAGNPKRVSFAYYIAGTTTSTGWNPGGAELRVLPKTATAKQLIAVSYLMEPTQFVDENSTTQFPISMARTLASWALQYIAIKQGDNTTLFTVAEKDASELFNLAEVA